MNQNHHLINKDRNNNIRSLISKNLSKKTSSPTKTERNSDISPLVSKNLKKESMEGYISRTEIK